jgi:hypothetical protein
MTGRRLTNSPPTTWSDRAAQQKRTRILVFTELVGMAMLWWVIFPNPDYREFVYRLLHAVMLAGSSLAFGLAAARALKSRHPWFGLLSP